MEAQPAPGSAPREAELTAVSPDLPSDDEDLFPLSPSWSLVCRVLSSQGLIGGILLEWKVSKDKGEEQPCRMLVIKHNADRGILKTVHNNYGRIG